MKSQHYSDTGYSYTDYSNALEASLTSWAPKHLGVYLGYCTLLLKWMGRNSSPSPSSSTTQPSSSPSLNYDGSFNPDCLRGISITYFLVMLPTLTSHCLVHPRRLLSLLGRKLWRLGPLPLPQDSHSQLVLHEVLQAWVEIEGPCPFWHRGISYKPKAINSSHGPKPI